MLTDIAKLLYDGTNLNSEKFWQKLIKEHGAWSVHHSEDKYIVAVVIDWDCQYEK